MPYTKNMATRFNTNPAADNTPTNSSALTHTATTILNVCIHKLTAAREYLNKRNSTEYEPIEQASKRLQDRIDNGEEFASTTDVLGDLATEHGFEIPE